MPAEEHRLVAPSDIAEMANVSRGAVSNWRKRSPDFPQPVAGTPAKPLFGRDDVLLWLLANNKEVRNDQGQQETWSALNTLRDVVRIEDMPQLVLAIACARKLSDQANTALPPWIWVRDHVHELGLRALDLPQDLATEEWPDLVHLPRSVTDMPVPAAALVIDAFDNIDSEHLADVADYALNRIANAQVRAGVEFGFVGSKISTLLANLAGPDADGVVYDPACGIGAALVSTFEVAQQAGHRPWRAIGHDVSAEALLVAGQRCFLRGIDVELSRTNVLVQDADPNLEADTIIVEPPFGLPWGDQGTLADPRWRFGTPPPSSADTAWLQHVIAHLAPGGRGYVVTPRGPLFRGGREQAIRTELVRQGCVEAVLGLPGKMLPHTSIPLVVWVLCRPGDLSNPDEILFVDGSDATEPELNIRSWLWAGTPGNTAVPPYRSVTVRDVFAGGCDLNPSRWIDVIERNPTDVARNYTSSLVRLNQSLDELAEIKRPVQPHHGPSESRITTVADLIAQGALELKSGRARQPDGHSSDDLDHARALAEARHVAEGGLPKDSLDLVDQGDDLTRPGDVLVITMNRVRTLVDHEGGHLLGNGVYRLRSHSDEIWAPYLAAVLAGPWNDRFQTGSTIKRAKIRDLEVPLVPPSEQVSYLHALETISSIRDRAQHLGAEAGQVEGALLDVLRYNATLEDL